MKVGKRILRYIAGTITHGLWYTASADNTLVGYTDSDFAGDLSDRKSTSGYVFLFGKNLISWASRKQPIVSLSSIEGEYVATLPSSMVKKTLVGFWLYRKGPYYNLL